MGTFGMPCPSVTTTTGLAPPPNQYGDASNTFNYSLFAAQPPATTLTQQQQLHTSSYGGSAPPPSYSDVMQGAAGAPPRPSFAGPSAPPLDDDDTYILQPIVVQNAAYPGQLPSPMTRLRWTRRRDHLIGLSTVKYYSAIRNKRSRTVFYCWFIIMYV